MGRRYDIDWFAIESDYRIGQLSIRMMATKHRVAVSSITRRAKRRNWRRGDPRPFVHKLTWAGLDRDSVREQMIKEHCDAYLKAAPNREEERW